MYVKTIKKRAEQHKYQDDNPFNNKKKCDQEGACEVVRIFLFLKLDDRYIDIYYKSHSSSLTANIIFRYFKI